MSKYLVVKSEVSFSVSVEDLNVHLRSKGATQTVLAASAELSADLRDKLARRWVSLSHQGIAASRMWPTARPVLLPPLPPGTPSPVEPPAAASPPAVIAPSAPLPTQDTDLLRVLRGIDQKLGDLLTRPSAPPAEVVAAHVRAISSLSSVPDGLPGAAHPQFIPSTILPEGAEAGSTIKVKREASDVSMDESMSALKKLRKKT